MSNSHFSKFPQINLPRSRFKVDYNHQFSMQHGYLTPECCYEVLPGDSWDAKKIAHLVHMATPIVPFMDSIDFFCRAFFCPTRLVWKNFETFMGANKGAGYQTVFPVFPADQHGTLKSGTTINAYNMALNLSHMLGKPVQDWNIGSQRNLPKPLSVLKERIYFTIWNNYFRSEQLEGEYPVDTGDGVIDGSGNYVAKVLLTDDTSSYVTYDVWNHELLKVNKKFDFFTSCTIAPQYGASVSLPLGTTAPVIVGADHNMQGNLKFGSGSSNSNITSSLYLSFGPTPTLDGTAYFDKSATEAITDPAVVTRSNLVADLSNATAATINSLRYAFAVQRYLERSNYGSNHFYEILAVHYGVSSPDARLQRPEYLGGFHFRINVDQVLNMTGKTDTDQTELATKGAVSVTADRHFGYTKGFVEPGYVMILVYTKQDRSYSDMVLLEDIKTDRFEFYSPEFANIGDQEVLKFNLSGKQTNDDVFGYQEAWAEYRYMPRRVSGFMNPSVSGSLPYWNLSDFYTSVPSLGPTWMKEDRNNIARALVSGNSNTPDFMVDCYIDFTAARLMPVYSIPGLIDHVGAM